VVMALEGTGGMVAQGGWLRRFGNRDGGSIGTVETNLAGHEFAEPFLVFGGEVKAEFVKGLVGHWVCMPQVTGQCENTGQFEEKECEIDESNICNGITTNGCNASDLAEAFPKSFNGVRGGPQCCDAGSIGLQLGTSDEAIGTVQMSEHVGNGDISKSKGVIIESTKV